MRDYPETRTQDQNASKAFGSHCSEPNSCPEDPHFLLWAKPVWRASEEIMFIMSSVILGALTLQLLKMYSISLGNIISQKCDAKGKKKQ